MNSVYRHVEKPSQPSPRSSAAKNREEATALDGLHTKRWAAYIWKALTRHSVNPTAATKRRSLKFHRESPVWRVDISSSLYEFLSCVRVHEPHLSHRWRREQRRRGRSLFLRVTGNVMSKQWRTLIGLAYTGVEIIRCCGGSVPFGSQLFWAGKGRTGKLEV